MVIISVSGKKLLKLAIWLLAVVAMLLVPCAAARPVFETTSIDGSRSVHLPLRRALVRGPESVAFDGNGTGPYSGVSDGRVLKWNEQTRRWSTYAYGPGYNAKACTASRTRPAEVTESIRGSSAGRHVVSPPHSLPSPLSPTPHSPSHRPPSPSLSGSLPFSLSTLLPSPLPAVSPPCFPSGGVVGGLAAAAPAPVDLDAGVAGTACGGDGPKRGGSANPSPAPARERLVSLGRPRGGGSRGRPRRDGVRRQPQARRLREAVPGAGEGAARLARRLPRAHRAGLYAEMDKEELIEGVNIMLRVVESRLAAQRKTEGLTDEEHLEEDSLLAALGRTEGDVPSN